jgi:prophage DNA circulation protein
MSFGGGGQADALAGFVQEAQYEGITFPCGVVSNDLAHSSVEHVSYGRDGADIEPTGLDAERGTIVVPFINDLTGYGQLFPDLYSQLLEKFKEKPIGNLQHPVLGTFTAHLKSWREEWDPDVRNGLSVTIQWVEHNASIGTLITDAGSPPQDTPAAAQNAANSADAAMGAVSATGWTATAPVVSAQLAALDSNLTLTPNDVASSVNTMTSVATSNLALPIFSQPSAHSAIVALESLRNTVNQLPGHYLPDSDQFRIYTTPFLMAYWQVAVAVYGDASLSSLILAANPLPDPLQIPAGTVLTILPNSSG